MALMILARVWCLERVYRSGCLCTCLLVTEENSGEVLPVCWYRVFKERSADYDFQRGVQVTLVGYMPVGYCWVSAVMFLSCPWNLWLYRSQYPILFWLDRISACAITVSTMPQALKAGEEPGCPQVFPDPQCAWMPQSQE